MKKTLLALLTALGSGYAWQRARRTRAEQALWSEATDPVVRE